MAKKSKETGPGVFMILVLVFFVLASAILGVTTYLGFSGQEELDKEAKTAREEKKKVEANLHEEQVRKEMNRAAIGTITDVGRETLNGLAKEQSANMLDEYQMITSKLGKNAFPTADAFTWELIAEVQKGGPTGEKKPATDPKNTVQAITKLWAGMYQDMKTKYNNEIVARKKAEMAAQSSQDAAKAAKDDFDAKVAALTAEVKDKTTAMDKAFQALKVEADKKGLDFKKAADEYADARAKIEEQLQAKLKEIEVLKQLVTRLQNPDPSDIEAKWRSFNPAKVSESMGSIADKSDTLVTLKFATKMNLVPGQTFVVIPPSTSLVSVIEREKALDKRHYEFSSLGAREPFSDNEMIKGMVEITDVTGNGYTARARITHQPQPIRNPIGKNDLIFNLTLSSGAKEHVAFAGIIDLDGDGRPDNEQFVRILENNNLIVDAYLDLKSGQVKKRGQGINPATKFLIVGTDAPLVGNVKQMIDDAKKDGVQVIDGRMFLHLIGVKPPKNPAPPAYTTVELGAPSGAPPMKEGEAPMPPAVPEKK